MDNESSLKRYPIIPFVILVYLLALPIMLLGFTDMPFEPILVDGYWTPNIAAFLVLGLVLRERGGIKRLVSGWGKWRVGALWYLMALSPFFIAFLAAGAWVILGGTPTDPEQPVGMLLLVSLIMSVVTGALGEELGWRGFLLPLLQQRFSALISSLIVGVIWALWHLPLWLLPGYGWEAIPYWAFALVAISSSILFTFVLNNTGGSLVMASIIHLMINYGMSVVGILGLLPSPREGWIIVSLLYALYAILIVVSAGPARLSRLKVGNESSFAQPAHGTD